MSDEFETGFFVREPAWHGKGTVVADYPEDDAEALKWAGLEWEPELVPVYLHVTLTRGDEIPAGFIAESPYSIEANGVFRVETDDETGESVRVLTCAKLVGFAPSQKTKAVCRNDNGIQLAHASPHFGFFYNSWMTECVRAVREVAPEGSIKVETMGSLRGGAKTWALIRLDEPVYVAGDDTPTYPFLVVLNSHDGSGSAKILYTGVRVVCMNTYSLADMLGTNGFTFRHVGDLREQFDEAKAALAGMRSSFNEWVNLAETLASYPVDESQVSTFANMFIPEPFTGTDRAKENAIRDRGIFQRLYNESVTTDGHRGSALGLVDAAIEFGDHVRRTRDRESLINRTLLKPQPYKGKVLELVANVCDIPLNVGAN